MEFTEQESEITQLIEMINNILDMVDVGNSINYETHSYESFYPLNNIIEMINNVFRLKEKLLLLEIIYNFIKIQRFSMINEELIRKAMCPARLVRHLELGGDIDDF
jgi:DNA mismatch repair ATPase MutS